MAMIALGRADSNSAKKSLVQTKAKLNDQLARTELFHWQLLREKRKLRQAKLRAEREKLTAEIRERAELAAAEKKKQEQIRALEVEMRLASLRSERERLKAESKARKEQRLAEQKAERDRRERERKAKRAHSIALAAVESQKKEQLREMKRRLREAEKGSSTAQAYLFFSHMLGNRKLIYEAFQGMLSIAILVFIAYLYFTTFRSSLLPDAKCTGQNTTDNQAFLSSCLALQTGTSAPQPNASLANLFESPIPFQANPSIGGSPNTPRVSPALFAENASCSLSLPKQPAFILRLDDVQAYAWAPTAMNMTEDALKRNLSIVWGVIPKNIDSNPTTVNYLESKAADSRVEFAQHGLNHAPNEFLNVNASELVRMTLEGTAKLHDTFDIYPITFIPPYNAINNSATGSFSNTSIRIVSGKEKVFKFDGQILYVGFTETTKVYPGDEEPADAIKRDLEPVGDILSGCSLDFEKNNLCVIMMHPQDYVSQDRRTVDSAKYTHYIELLEGLKKTGAASITFRDLIDCKQKNANAG